MNDIQEVKSRLDIAQVVAQYVPTLKRAGRSYKGNCPFHKEKTPSFIVTPDLQIFKCFGCGEAGDVIEFIKKIERVEFGEALKIAADKAGYQLTDNYGSKEDEKFKQEKERIYNANKLATQYWNYILKTHKAGKIGRDYVAKRKIRIEEIDKFQLGYAPKGDNLVKFMRAKGFNDNELITWGLAVEKNGNLIDKFRDRLILPIWDMAGHILGFSGRIVMPNEYAPKYLNSPETQVYKKGEILMGLYQAKESARANKYLILEEGNIDLLSSHKVGVENIAATGGTALTEKQCKLIKRYADTVYFCFDTDNAGVKALMRGLEIAERIGLAHKALDIGNYQDPDELISKEPQKWSEVIENPLNTVSHLIKILQADLDLGSADGKSTFLNRITPALASLKDEVQLQHFAGEVAVLTGVSKQAVLDRLSKPDRQHELPDFPEAEPEEIPVSTATHPTNQREIYLLALLVQISQIGDLEVSKETFRDINCQEIFVAIQRVGDTTINFATLADSLSDGGKETLQQVLAVDLSNVSDLKGEFERVYQMAYTNFLRGQILELRRKLSVNLDDETSLQKLKYFTQELQAHNNKVVK